MPHADNEGCGSGGHANILCPTQTTKEANSFAMFTCVEWSSSGCHCTLTMNCAEAVDMLIFCVPTYVNERGE